jgi:multiple sugar transport system substrate-binding protein
MKHWGRRVILFGAIAASLVIAAVTATASQGRTDAQAAPAAQEVAGSIRLAGWTSGGSTEGVLLKQVLAGFAKKYPKIKVTYTALDPYQQNMLAQFAARRPPDVFYVDSNDFPDWAKQGLLEPLGPYITKYKFSTKPFHARLLNAFRYKGKLYGFPKGFSPLSMEINTSMLARVGGRAPTTWAGLRTLAQRMKAANIPAGGRPICLQPEWQRLLAFVYQNGGSLLNANKTRATVTSAAVREAVNFYVGLINDGLAGTQQQLGAGWCGEALGKEKAAITFEGNWIMPFMAEQFPNVNYRVHRMVKNKQAATLSFTVSYSIAKASKNKAAAWTLLTYLTGRPGMTTWTSKGLELPSRKDVKLRVPGRTAYIQDAAVGRAWQFAPGFSRVITVANNELTAVLEGKQTVNGMLAKIQEAANEALR